MAEQLQDNTILIVTLTGKETEQMNVKSVLLHSTPDPFTLGFCLWEWYQRVDNIGQQGVTSKC